jgi:hypothetical protein
MTDRTFNVTRREALVAGGATLGGLTLGTSTVLGQNDDDDDDANRYRVTIANNTSGQPFTPPAVAAHTADIEVFAVGDHANEPTRQLAENGRLGPLSDLASSADAVRGVAVGDAPLVPQADPAGTGNPWYTILHLTADEETSFLTFVSMLIATNDGIVGLDTVPLPDHVNESRTYHANGYDVGTEQNTELFADLVPPAKTLILGGEPEGTTESDEEISEDKVIRPHPGIQGVGNLPPSVYDWDEPAALVQVERLSD